MSKQLKAAIVRAVVTAVIAGAWLFLSDVALKMSFRDAGIGAGIVILSNLLTRGAGEGWLDSTRNDSGAATPADVGYVAPNVVRVTTPEASVTPPLGKI
jgi:hypothetical protein